MKLLTLNDLFILKIRALYDIEQQLVKALPKMSRNSTDPDLQKGFEDHLVETQNNVSRLERIFEILGIKPSKTKVEGIRGLISDAEWIINEEPEADALDALLISSASYVEHYEMAGYVSAIDWAQKLNLTEAVELLDQTLEEENIAADKLSNLAREKINEKVMR